MKGGEITRVSARVGGVSMRGQPSAGVADLLHSAAGDPLDAAEAERVFAEVWSRVQADVARGGGVVEDDFERRRLDVIAKAQVASRRRRQLVRGVSLTTAVVLAGGGVAAAADFIAARTGERTTGWEVDAAGPGEVLNAGGTDYPQVLREITADIPFAPGWEHERDVALNGFYLAPEAGSSVTEGAVRATVTDYAVCRASSTCPPSWGLRRRVTADECSWRWRTPPERASPAPTLNSPLARTPSAATDRRHDRCRG